MTKPHFSDHYLHSICVGTLGAYLLECPLFNIGNKKQKLITEFSKIMNVEPNKVVTIWWMAALLHDFAYPINILIDSARDLAEELKQKFRLMGLQVSWPKFKLGQKGEKAAQILLNYAKSKMESTDYEKLRGLIENSIKINYGKAPNHGILSSILCLCTLPSHKPEVLEASLAICLHGLDDFTILFDHLPIAFLLILCDEAQEFNRERRQPKILPWRVEGPRFTPKYEVYVAAKKVKLEITDSSIEFKITFDKNILKYGFDYKGYVDKKIKNLKRLKIDSNLYNLPTIKFQFSINGSIGKSITIGE